MDETNQFNSNILPNTKLTLDEYWKATNLIKDNGIEGYELPRLYFDHIQSKKYHENWDLNTGKKIKSDWPPHNLKDDTGKINWPKRKNYIDQIDKWSKSFYDKEKADKVIEYLEEKNRPLDKKPEIKKIDEKLQRFNVQGDRKTYIDLIKKKEEKKYLQYPYKEDKILELKEKIDLYYKKKKNKYEIILDKYSIKGSLPKNERISVISNSEHLGQKIPFCNEEKKEAKEEDPENKKEKNNKKYFSQTTFPKKNFVWNRAPCWKFLKPILKTDEEKQIMENRKEQEKERAQSTRESLLGKMKLKNFDINFGETFTNMLSFRKIKIGFGKVTCLDKEQQDRFKSWTKDCPKKIPGANTYFKTKPIPKVFGKDKKMKKYETVINDDGSKTHYVDRSTTDKAIYKPMNSFIY